MSTLWRKYSDVLYTMRKNQLMYSFFHVVTDTPCLLYYAASQASRRHNVPIYASYTVRLHNIISLSSTGPESVQFSVISLTLIMKTAKTQTIHV